MNNHTIVYCPYKSESLFAPFLMVISIISFVLSGSSLGIDITFTLGTITFGVISLFLAKALYISSDLALIFRSDEILIVGGKFKNYNYIKWEVLSYVYYAKNYKGHKFLILSPEKLDKKQTQTFANKSTNTSRILFDSTLVIHIDPLQNFSQIEKIVKEKIRNTGDGSLS